MQKLIFGSLLLTGFNSQLQAQETVQNLPDVVVTATRTETEKFKTPQSVQIIAHKDIEQTFSVDLTDVLKKNAGLDVVQYPGVLSGIGMRGFRPEFSGINKRSLLLIDGRSAGTTNLSMIQMGMIDRVEVVKGPASALYGPSAMGGVVNLIPKRSHGEISGKARAGYGFFDTRQFGFEAGGDLGPFNFDYAGAYYDQDDDFVMGNGESRANTHFKTVNNAFRLGLPINGNLNLESYIDSYFGMDIATPGDIFNGEGDQSNKDIDRWSGHVRLDGDYDWGNFKFTLYRADQADNSIKNTTLVVAERPFLPFRTFASDTDWWGAQAQMSLPWWSGQHKFIMGFDYDEIGQETRSYTPQGQAKAPFSADLERRNWGIFAQNELNFDWFGGETILSLGARFDEITLETFKTPLKTDFTPTASAFEIFSPRMGFAHLFTPRLRLHGTVGTGFTPPEASQFTGFDQRTSGGRVQITQGNPDLQPESAIGWDIGLGWTDNARSFDVTYFETIVEDKIASVVVKNPPAPGAIINSYRNADSSFANGLEFQLQQAITPAWTLFGDATWFFSRTEKINNVQRNSHNVAELNGRLGLAFEQGPFNARLSGRYVGHRNDFDFNAPTRPIIRYPDFATLDFSAGYQFYKGHRLDVQAGNLLDKYYFEKLGFPLAGRQLNLIYSFKF